MIRRAFSALALSAVLAVPAVAQSPFQQNFSANVVSGDTYDNFFGQFNNPTPPGLAGVFQYFCVDQDNTFASGSTYNVWVTPMSASDQSHIYNPGGDAWGGGNGSYLEAARLASAMLGTEVPDLTSNQVLDLQNAIWYVMGFNPAGGAADYTWAKTLPGYQLATVVPNQWLVITRKNNRNGRTQEFIYNDATRPPQETVPEPATMSLLATGLVGLAGARRRRNKKS